MIEIRIMDKNEKKNKLKACIKHFSTFWNSDIINGSVSQHLLYIFLKNNKECICIYG